MCHKNTTQKDSKVFLYMRNSIATCAKRTHQEETITNLSRLSSFLLKDTIQISTVAETLPKRRGVKEEIHACSKASTCFFNIPEWEGRV